jgi:hypothetical protein
VEAIPQPSEPVLVSIGTPVSFVAFTNFSPSCSIQPCHHDRDERANRQAVTRMAIHLPPSTL